MMISEKADVTNVCIPQMKKSLNERDEKYNAHWWDDSSKKSGQWTEKKNEWIGAA